MEVLMNARRNKKMAPHGDALCLRFTMSREIELAEENEAFAKPDWLGEEVTGRSEYFNNSLIQRPYQSW